LVTLTGLVVQDRAGPRQLLGEDDQDRVGESNGDGAVL